MMKRITITSFLLFASLFSSACLNEYRTLLSGRVIYTDPSEGRVWHRKVDTNELEIVSSSLLESYKRSDSIEYYSDYAAALIYLGEYQKAKYVYEEIEQKSPNLYTTASNLGTIYELIGRPDSAIIWIRKSMELNPQSHKGSEWIHIKILEFKLRESQNFDHSILGLNFGDEELPSNPNQYDLEELKKHIWYQLYERTTFIDPPNKIIGNIYFDLGNILAQTRDVQTGLESYDAAKEYGFQSDLLIQRERLFMKLASKANRKEAVVGLAKRNYKTTFILCMVLGIVLVGFTFRFVNKRINK